MATNKDSIQSASQDRYGLSRRDFISKTTLAGVGLAVAPFVGSASCIHPANDASSHNETGRSMPVMDKRNLGALEVSALGLGCMNMAWAYYLNFAECCLIFVIPG